MRNRHRLFGAALVALATTLVSALPAETVDELLARLESKSKAIDSYTTKLKTVVEGEYMKSESTTVASAEKHGDIYKMHALTEGTTKMSFPGMPAEGSETKMRSLMVSDGQVAWAESEANGQKTVMKMKAVSQDDAFESLRQTVKMGTATVKPSETVSGHECDVLELVQDMGGVKATMTFWFDKETGVMLRSESEAAGTTTKMTVEEFEKGQDIDDSKFEYTPPKDVPITDMTNQ